MNIHYNCMETMGRVKRMHKPELKYAAPFGILVSPLDTLIVIKFCLTVLSFLHLQKPFGFSSIKFTVPTIIQDLVFQLLP